MSDRGTLIWDFDGTVATRNFSWDGAFLTALEATNPGHGVTNDDLLREFRAGFPWHAADDEAVERVDTAMWWARMEAFFIRVFDNLGFGNDATALAQAVHEQAVRYDDYVLIPDAIPTLAACQEDGWNQVILSNHMPDLPNMVQGLGLGPFISQTFTSASMGFSKPHPQIFKKALAALPSRENVWMIGDSYEADIVGAESVGLPGILVRSAKGLHTREAADLTEAMRIFSAPS